MNTKIHQKAPVVQFSKRTAASDADYSKEVTAGAIAKLEEAFRDEFDKHEWEEESARAW